MDDVTEPASDEQAPAPPTTPPEPDHGPRVIDTDADAVDGLTKCPRCGATQIALNIGSGMLRCHYCRDEWSTPSANEAFGLDAGVGELRGVTRGSGSSDIVPSAEIVLTFKCSACGAEIVIDTASSTQARCHWCRNTLSMNQQVPNGAVPDMVLPFSLPKEEAVRKIATFVRKRRFFAHPRFRKEFDPDNVLGAYLPYMVVDVNAHAAFSGQGEHQTRSYTVSVGEDRSETRYDADLYDVGRAFDVEVHDLAVVSSQQRLDQGLSTTNNVINAIRPFDLENAVVYDSNYLAGFTSERRDTNIDDLAPIVDAQSKDVARHAVHDTLRFYDRGVRWHSEQLEVRGQRWVSAYLPVWLYSYHQTKRDGRSVTHYVAVNGRTGAVMGSVPINYPRLLLTSAVVEAVGIVVGTAVMIFGGGS
ncbi:TFIIB-type zinc ribbon-containing protein [Isoptericola haloaureus]|uniref:TFIIB-type zinc ribbon-containing protein n=1 Tax=Isoptericola haloaureus TaxID=1542902 RepID=A0ABU7Z7W8_9MICO